MGELERLAAATLFPGFPGPLAPEWVLRWAERGLGGVVLFAWNVASREQVATLCARLRDEREDLLIAIDEEGGDVTRLEAASGSSYPGNLALGEVDDPGLTERVAAAMADDLAAAGVNWDLAPVADVNTNPRNPIIGVRSFGSDPELAARHVAAFVRGLQSRRVAACAKHFPGHGDTELDSHLELPLVHGDLEAALVPFRAAIEAGARSIMTAHIGVPALDSVPATLSRRILHQLLREQLGYQGVVITDALEMRAISAGVGVEEGAVQALAAGADALCTGHDLHEPEIERVHGAIVEAASSGRLAPERLAEAAGRVEAMARWASADPRRAGGDEEVGLEAARRAVRAEGCVRLSEAPFVVELLPEPSIAAGETGHSLAGVLAARGIPGEAVRLGDDPLGLRALLESARGHRLVLVLRDAHRFGWIRSATEAILAAEPQTIVVETGLPLWKPHAGGYVTTLGNGRVNLEAAAELLRPATVPAAGR
ncbi:MAG: glycoside hydrolase family 3 protein [Gaiellaceae bacterium]